MVYSFSLHLILVPLFCSFPGQQGMLIKNYDFCRYQFPDLTLLRNTEGLWGRECSLFIYKDLKEGWLWGKLGTRELSQRLRKRRHFLKTEFALFKNFKSIIPFCSVCQMKAIYFFKGLYIKVQKKKSFAFGKFPPFKVVISTTSSFVHFQSYFFLISRPVSSAGRASDF